jgi:hypothetical protein
VDHRAAHRRITRGRVARGRFAIVALALLLAALTARTAAACLQGICEVTNLLGDRRRQVAFVASPSTPIAHDMK